MEDSKKLIDELLAKLTELDSKVDSFRQDMLSEFNKFTEDLLKGMPDNVSDEVSRVIAESMAKYPSLSMPSPREPDSPVTPTFTEAEPPREAPKSPPPILFHTSGIPKFFRQEPRGPHDREFEFQGLFTPSYLPLLDGNDPPIQQQRVNASLAFRRSSPLIPGGGPYPGGEPPYDSPTLTQSSVNNDDDAEVAVVEMIEEVEMADTGKGKGKDVVRPSPVRQLTDVSISSSVGSSTSDHKIRRSALRRSSSSTKGSPRGRRVRFDFEGTEVLPTASPQPTDSVLGTVDDLDLDAAFSSSIDDSADYAGPSLSDVEGEEDYRPRPTRISSTEALRRLSRTPSDDGTVWVPSNEAPPPRTNGHGSSEPGPSATSSLAEAPTSSALIAAPTMSLISAPSGNEDQPRHATTTPTNGKQATQAVGSPSEAEGKQHEDDGDSSSEDEFLAIKSPKKALSPSSTSPSAISLPAKSPLAQDFSSQIRGESPKASRTAKDKDKGKEKVSAQHVDQEELFDFDDPVTGLATVEKYLPEEEEDDAAENRASAPDAPHHLYSASPAVSIPQRKSPSPPTLSKPVAESIGSYKGQPLRMNVVVSPKIVEEAAAMGDVKTYVGSVHGRTGIDPADERSYRASFSNAQLFSGTPRSFSERLMMEEAMGEKDDDDVD